MEGTNTTNQPVTASQRIVRVLDGNCKQHNVCLVKDILARFGDKWTMYALLLLGKNDKLRFNELKSGITGISQRMLTVTLRTLEEDGIVLRIAYAEIPPRVEYSLTSLGHGLLEQVLQLASWADAHFDEIAEAREVYHAKNGDSSDFDH